MLGDKPTSAVLAAKDLAISQKFYEEVLGLKKTDMDSPGGTLYKSADQLVFIYPSEQAGTNQATALTWAVGGDFDAIVADLKTKGVAFEQYDIPGMTREGEVHKMGNMRSVWFKDPAGNILNVIDQ
jgi:catechol-2,3-dioxygenase